MDLKELAESEKDIKNKRHPWEQARVNFVYKKIKKYLDPSSDTIFLDIGCGDTYVAEYLLEKIPSSSFYCVDTAFTTSQLEFYSKKYTNKNIKVFNKIEDAIHKIDSNISFVLLLDVIEHIEQDLSFLKHVNSMTKLTENSKMIITVPAFQSLFTNHDEILGHYRRYTNKSLNLLIEKAGFKAVGIGYFFTSLLLPRFLIKIKEKFNKPKITSTSVSTWNKGNLISCIFKNILIFDFSVTSILEKLNIKLFGLSNYIVCKKHVS